MITSLPDEMFVSIFRYLNRNDLEPCFQVDKSWNRICNDNDVWRSVSQTEFLNTTPLSLNLNIKELIHQFHLTNAKSNDEIIDKFQGFLNRYSLDQDCRFRCIIGSGRGTKHITVTIKNTANLILPIIHKEDCLCTGGIGDGSLERFHPDPRNRAEPLITEHFGLSASEEMEPDYSNPEQSYEFAYGITEGRSLTHEFKIYFPIPVLDGIGEYIPLEQQIVSMTISKSTELSVRRSKIIFLPMTILVLGFSICIFIQIWCDLEQASNKK